MKVKICGLTRPEDAEAALDAGADYLGFVFHPPSPRFIEPAKAGELINHLGTHGRLADGRARCVGLCVNLTPQQMNEAAARSGSISCRFTAIRTGGPDRTRAECSGRGSASLTEASDWPAAMVPSPEAQVRSLLTATRARHGEHGRAGGLVLAAR